MSLQHDGMSCAERIQHLSNHHGRSNAICSCRKHRFFFFIKNCTAKYFFLLGTYRCSVHLSRLPLYTVLCFIVVEEEFEFLPTHEPTCQVFDDLDSVFLVTLLPSTSATVPESNSCIGSQRMSFSSRRRNYLLIPHRRDGLIEW